MKLLRRLVGFTFGLYCLVANAQVDKKFFGDWFVNVRGSWVELASINSSGSSFGAMCNRDAATCRFYLRTDVACDRGAVLPVLLNADGTALPANVKCGSWMKRSGEVDLYWFEEFRPIVDLLLDKQQLGVVAPFSDGTFGVSRFTLRGYMDAFIHMGELVQARKSGTGDSRL